MTEANMKRLQKPNQCWEAHIKWSLKYGLSGHGLQCVTYVKVEWWATEFREFLTSCSRKRAFNVPFDQ